MARETIEQIMRGVAFTGKPKKMANNTVCYFRPNGEQVWRLHHTDVVVKTAEGFYVLNSGGWKTSTTRDRINTFAPVRLYQRQHEWYLAGRTDDGALDFDAAIPFVDGMTVNAHGIPLDIFKPEEA
jgi:hypothetical protein